MIKIAKKIQKYVFGGRLTFEGEFNRCVRYLGTYPTMNFNESTDVDMRVSLCKTSFLVMGEFWKKKTIPIRKKSFVYNDILQEWQATTTGVSGHLKKKPMAAVTR